MKISSGLLEDVFDLVAAGFLAEVNDQRKYGVSDKYVNPDIGGGYTPGSAKFNGAELISSGAFSAPSVNADMLSERFGLTYVDTSSVDRSLSYAEVAGGRKRVQDIDGLVRTVSAGQWWKTNATGNNRYNLTETEADAVIAHALGRLEQVGANAGNDGGLRGQYYALVLQSLESDYKMDVMAASNATEVLFGTLARDYQGADWIGGINKLSNIMSGSADKNAQIEEERRQEVINFLEKKHLDAQKVKAKSSWDNEHARAQSKTMGRSGLNGSWSGNNSGIKGSPLKAVRCTHGMIRSMGALICSGSNAPNAVCCEMSLTEGTTKAGACITCAMYMWSCGAGFNRLHLGASELWSLPSGVNMGLQDGESLYEATNLRRLDAEPVRLSSGGDADWGNTMLNKKNKQWGDDIARWFAVGYNLAYPDRVLSAQEMITVIEKTMQMNLGKRLHISEVYLMSLGLGRKARDVFTEGLKD